MKPVLIYCYDAYCGWCFGFSNVISQVADNHKHQLDIEVISGGMLLPDKPVHIRAMAPHILKEYPQVEKLTGVTFGKDFLWHINNCDDSDWFPNSEKPAIAMSIFKEFYPQRSVEFARDLQHALHVEGRDLTDDAAYRHLLEKYSIQPELFYQRLHSDEYKENAYYDFALARQLQVTGYPCVFIQTSELKFHLIARGFTVYETVEERLKNALEAEGRLTA